MNYEPEDYSIFIHRYRGDYIATCLEFGPGINVVEDTREDALREILESIRVCMELDPHIAPYTSLVRRVGDDTFHVFHNPETYVPHTAR